MPKLPPGAALPEVLAFIHAQLDSIEPEVKLQEQFKLVGRGHRRTGGAPRTHVHPLNILYI